MLNEIIKDKYKQNSKNFSKTKEINNIIDKQIDAYFDIVENSYELNYPKYNIGDKVILNKNSYLHGIGENLNALELVSKNGILSKEATGDFGNHAFRFVVGLWKVSEEISLGDYIRNYSGIVAKYNDIAKQVPYGDLDNFVEEMRDVDHWLWRAESSMEIRFMPSLARDINQIGFIINLDNKGSKLLLNDINSKDFDKELSLMFLKEGTNIDFFSDKNNDFLNRASYIIFGIPNNFIEGILVGRIVEHDTKKLDYIKSLFPKCYISNLDGIVIRK